MDPKDITIDMLRQRTDLIEELNRTSSAQEQIKKLTEDLTAAKAKIDGFEAKAALDAKRLKISKLVEEAKLPKEVVTKTFMEQLETAADDAAITRIIEDRKAIAGVVGKAQGKPRAGEQTLSESAGRESGTPGHDNKPLTLESFVNGMKTA